MAAGGEGGGPTQINLQINGRTFARATVNDFRALLLQKNRTVINLGLA
ncbi:MAG: hypothetical protein ABR972_13025 [Acidimicrobiales bacterium]